MSTYVWCELVCEHCSQTIIGEFSTSDRIPRRSLKSAARKTGAVFSGDYAFCCKTCHQAAEDKNDE